MHEKPGPKTWLEIIVARKLAQGAVLPPSSEQIDEAVARKRQEIADKHALEQAKSDIVLDNLFKAARAKYN